MPTPQHLVRYFLNSPWRKMSFSAFLILGLMGSLMACTGGKDTKTDAVCETGGYDNPSIFNGHKASSQSWLGRSLVSVVAKKYYKKKNGYSTGICTGTLIDRNMVLTAAHCLPVAAPGDYVDASDVKVIFSVDPVCHIVARKDRSVMKPVAEYRMHEGYRSATTAEDSASYDLALLRLADNAPTDYQTMNLAGRTIPLNASVPILLAGYGTSFDYNSEIEDTNDLKYTTVYPYEGTNRKKSLRQMPTSPVLYSNQRKGTGACAGDSGGPAMTRNSEGSFVVIGVASQVDPLDSTWRDEVQEDVTCRQGIVHTSTLYHREWIEQNFRGMSGYYGKSTPFVD